MCNDDDEARDRLPLCSFFHLFSYQTRRSDTLRNDNSEEDLLTFYSAESHAL